VLPAHLVDARTGFGLLRNRDGLGLVNRDFLISAPLTHHVKVSTNELSTYWGAYDPASSERRRFQ
jgi:hypothetical protein